MQNGKIKKQQFSFAGRWTENESVGTSGQNKIFINIFHSIQVTRNPFQG